MPYLHIAPANGTCRVDDWLKFSVPLKRALGGGAEYASLSALERYKSVRRFYKRIIDALKACIDEDTWLYDEYEALERIAQQSAGSVRNAVRYGGLDDEEAEDAVYSCIPSMVALVTVEHFAIKEFMRGGMSGHARDLLVGGWTFCDPRTGSSSTEAFMHHVTGCEHWQC